MSELRRNVTVLLLFAAVMLVSAVQLRLLRNATERFTGLITECEQYVKTDSDFSECLAALGDYWDEYYSVASFLTCSDALPDMAADLSRLRTITDSSELMGELESLRVRAQLIYDEQVPHPQSVF